MSLFAWNLLLAALWAALANELTLLNLGFGFAMGYLVLFLAHRTVDKPTYFAKTWLTLKFVSFFVSELVTSSIRVAHDVLTKRHLMSPGVIAIPLDARSDLEITLFANLISLTPGTLSLDVSDDRQVLYIHVMYLDRDNVDSFRRQTKEGLERRILEILR